MHVPSGTQLQLRPLVLRLPRQPGPLRPQVLEALREHGRPLRWAITAVESSGMPSAAGGGSTGLQLCVEAVVCLDGSAEPGRQG